MTEMVSCIYCGVHVDPTKGEGDHVIPAALGEFVDDVRFRLICQTCNQATKNGEEQIIRCGPESLLSRYVTMKSRRTRRRRTGRHKGAAGAPAPEFTVIKHGFRVLVQPDPNDPRNVYPIEQLVVRGESGCDINIRLHPAMSAKKLKSELDRSGADLSKESFLDCLEANWETYQALISAVAPKVKLECVGSEHGVSQVKGSVKVTRGKDYARAIAKIAFHYYLCHTTRGLNGSEERFRPLRDFIRHGVGDEHRFLKCTGPPFVSPFGLNVAGGGQLRPVEFGHVLAARELQDYAVVYLHLFVGPIAVLDPHYVTLGPVGPIIAPAGVWSHSYKYEDVDGSNRFSGRVYRENVTPMRSQ